MVALTHQERADLGRHIGLGSTDQGDPPRLEDCRATRSAAAPAARRAATSAGSFTARTGEVTEDATCQVRSEEPRFCRARTDVAQAGSEMATWWRLFPSGPDFQERDGDGDGILVVGPRQDGEQVVGPGHPWGLEARHHQRGLPDQREHQHGQALQGHGLVAGQPGQVGAVGQQESVDPGGLHARSHAGHAPDPAGPGRCPQLGHEADRAPVAGSRVEEPGVPLNETATGEAASAASRA